MDDLPPPLEDASELVNNIKNKVERRKELENKNKDIKRDLVYINSEDKQIPKLINDTFTVKPEVKEKNVKKTSKVRLRFSRER
jgi:hypothetical protein